MRSELHHALVLASRVIFVYVVIMFLLNGIVMLASPQRWFRLPGWLRTQQGTLTEREHSSGWGAIRLRLMGAAFVGSVSWVLYSLLRHP